MTRSEAIRFRRMIEQASAWTDDADALEMVELFPRWYCPKAYIVGERISYDGLLYKCVQAHTSQTDWTPDATPALWVRVSVEEFPEWVQPQGSADAYMTGDKVSFEGKHYVSLIDGNVWSPSVYPAGWEEIS